MQSLRMNYSIKIKRGESIVYLVLWLVILLMPIFISNNDSVIDWSKVTREWMRFLPFLFVFLVHNYLLFPQFFIQKNRFLYFSLTLLLILLASFFAHFVVDIFNLNPAEPMQKPPRGPMPPMGSEIPPFRGDMPGRPNEPGPRPFHRLFIDNALVSVLVVGFNAAIKVTVIWQAEEQKNKDLEKEKLQTELAFLKNQVSPHFFMNTLNNIHALIDINSEDAKESIIKLSKLMRYLLYESELGKTTLAKEIEFIKSYVDLMKLRFTEQVSVKLSFPQTIPNIEIPPMLFTSLLENAFKHGVSYQTESFIEIVMNADQKFLYFRIKNSIQNSNNGLIEKGGIGLDNLKKRLDLIYAKSYSLVQNETETAFEINIKLPLNET